MTQCGPCLPSKQRTADAFALESDYTRMKWLGLARAALEALRTPTEEMLGVLVEAYGDVAALPIADGVPLDVWQRMIDAALPPDSRSSKE